jgi:CheY-like chemotaxis protein
MERLLLVEHNLLFREGLALLLKWRTGLSSVYARSLAEAKGILDDANQKLACVIVDLDLPDGDGTELLKQLNGLPVVALIRQPVYLDDRYSATVRLLNTRDPAVGEMFVKTTGRSLIKGKGESSCFGDSGGPLFVGDQQTIVGVTSGGYPMCRGPEYYQRVDLPGVLKWVRSFPSPKGGAKRLESCEGRVVRVPAFALPWSKALSPPPP